MVVLVRRVRWVHLDLQAHPVLLEATVVLDNLELLAFKVLPVAQVPVVKPVLPVPTAQMERLVLLAIPVLMAKKALLDLRDLKVHEVSPVNLVMKVPPVILVALVQLVIRAHVAPL